MGLWPHEFRSSGWKRAAPFIRKQSDRDYVFVAYSYIPLWMTDLYERKSNIDFSVRESEEKKKEIPHESSSSYSFRLSTFFLLPDEMKI